jgi:hypothetical protein
MPVMRVKSVEEAVEHVNTSRLALQVCWPAFVETFSRWYVQCYAALGGTLRWVRHGGRIERRDD